MMLRNHDNFSFKAFIPKFIELKIILNKKFQNEIFKIFNNPLKKNLF